MSDRENCRSMVIHTNIDEASFYLVIDSLLRDSSSGGLRIAEDLDLEEVAALAREMTLKYSYIGLERGGAKSGLKIPSGTDVLRKRAILEAVGRRIGAIIRAGIYYPGMDMNCGPDDLRALYSGAGFNLRQITDTSFFTAVSVANAIEACVCRESSLMPPVKVAVEGFGSVSAHLAERLPTDRFRFVAISTVAGARACAKGFCARSLISLRKQWGDEFVNHLREGDFIDKRSLFTIEADILIPSARTWSISEDVARTIRARYVVPAANAPYSGDSVAILERNGIVALPGYVVNCGGVYGSSLHDSGVAGEQIEKVSAEQYRKSVVALLDRAQSTGVSPVIVAESIAERRFAEEASRVFKKTSWEKLCERARRSGVALRSWHARRMIGSFRANLERLEKQLWEWQPRL